MRFKMVVGPAKLMSTRPVSTVLLLSSFVSMRLMNKILVSVRAHVVLILTLLPSGYYLFL